MYEIAVLTIFPAAVIFAAFYDLVSYRIPNQISLALIGGFLALAPFAGLTWAEFGQHLAAGAIILAVMFGLFAFNAIGGGDAKLMAAISLWIGLPMLFDYVLIASLFGGALAMVLITFRTLPLPTQLLSQGWILKLHEPKGPLPYGIALAAGAIVIYPHTVWIKSLAG